MKRCSRCNQTRATLIYSSKYLYGICRVCEDRIEQSRELIASLPEVESKEAPFGYQFVHTRFFKEASVGAAYADMLFERLGLTEVSLGRIIRG